MREYNVAARHFAGGGEFLLLIGYSFGQRNGRTDDAESLEFLRELLKKFLRQIVVVDPHPEHMAGLFEDVLRLRIYACKLYWNYLVANGLGFAYEVPEQHVGHSSRCTQIWSEECTL